MKTVLTVVAVLVLALVAVLGAAAKPVQAQVSETKVIEIKEASLSGHGCNSQEWHIIINQIASPELAPAIVTMHFPEGTVNAVLSAFTGGAAHYSTTEYLGSFLLGATAIIYAGWDGQFVLSHGPCGNTDTPTPTNTVTVTETVTQTPTETVTETPTETATVTETPTGTVTLTQTVTQTETVTQTPTETVTGTPTTTVTDTPPADPTPTPTEPSLGGGRPTQEHSPISWLFATLIILSVASVVVFKKH